MLAAGGYPNQKIIDRTTLIEAGRYLRSSLIIIGNATVLCLALCAVGSSESRPNNIGSANYDQLYKVGSSNGSQP